MTERIILGIDPGTQVMGYGLITDKGSKIELICFDAIRFNSKEPHELRLKRIFDVITALIDEHHPDELAIEAPFYGKDIQAMLKLGRAQGVAMAAGLNRGIPIIEYSPRKVKQSVTGNGNASKEQVAGMLKNLLHLSEMPKLFDASDALAIAVCHYLQKMPAGGSKTSYSGWKAFMDQNPGRVKG